MTIIESVREYINTYSELAQFAKLNVDYLANKPTEYTIDPVPSEIVIEEDILGNSTRQFLFVFASREAFGPSALDNMANSGFYEDFNEWISEQNKNGVLPQLETGKTPTKIECLGLGYLFENDSDTARYQIQCRLIYDQKGSE